jgi:fructose-bisphosphate aldolase class II
MIVSFKEMLQAANNGRYAVGAFNCLSLENVEGAIAAAEELHSPIIIQLAEVQFPCAPLALMAPLYLEAARAAKVPVVVHLDHGQSFQTCADAVRLGFGSVMFDGASLPFEENVRQTAEVARMAKAFGVDVEAELGKVGDVGVDDDKVDLFTDVEESAEFIARTGVDALAVAIGNQHGKYVATPRLNIARLVELHERNAMPLVLHGGSGTSEEDFKSCIHNGICKINVATAIQLGVTEDVQHYLATASNPNYIDMKAVMVEASKRVVADHIRLFESNNRA